MKINRKRLEQIIQEEVAAANRRDSSLREAYGPDRNKVQLKSPMDTFNAALNAAPEKRQAEDTGPDWVSSAYAPTPFFQQGAEKWEDDPNIHQLTFRPGMSLPQGEDTYAGAIGDAVIGTPTDPGEASETAVLAGTTPITKALAPPGGMLRRRFPTAFGKHGGQFGHHAANRASTIGRRFTKTFGKALLPYELASAVHGASDVMDSASGNDQWDLAHKLDLSRRLTTPEQAKKDTQFWNLVGQRLGINESSLEENRLDQIIQEEYEKLLQEHAKEYVWGVKAPYHRTANQYELSVLNHDILKEKGKHHDMACG